MMQPCNDKIKVLFLCTGNSCRSQMAEGLLKHYGGEKFQVLSAGTAPAGVDPRAVQVMNEIGINISGQSSKTVTGSMLDDTDLLITLCGGARETCPVVPSQVQKQHWPLADPAKAEGSEDEIMHAFRLVRDQLADLVHKLIKQQS